MQAPLPRFHALGQTGSRRSLFVVFTMRGKLIRVVSARWEGQAGIAGGRIGKAPPQILAWAGVRSPPLNKEHR